MPTTRTEFARGELALTLDWLADGLIIMHEDGTILFWNRCAARIFGWTEEEALGRKLTELIIPVEFRRAHLRGVEHFIKTGEGPVIGRRLVVPARRKNGSLVTVSLRVSAAKSPGKAWHFTALVSEAREKTVTAPHTRLVSWWRRIRGKAAVK